MTTVLRFIWGLLRGLARRLGRLFGWLWDIASSWVSWVVAGLAYLVHTVSAWIQSAITGAFSWVGDLLELPDMPDIPALAAYVGKEWLALDTAFDLLVTLLGVYVLAKTARLLMVPVRAILELL